MTKIYILFVLLGFYSFVQGQVLNEFIGESSEGYLVRAENLRYQAALSIADQVDQLPDPEVSIGYFPLPVETRLGPQLLRLSLNQSIPWFGTLEANRNLVMSKAKLNKFNSEILIRKLELEVTQDYYRLLSIDSSNAIYNEQIVLIKSLKSLVQNNIASGFARMEDVLKVELEIENIRSKLNDLYGQKHEILSQLSNATSRRVSWDEVVGDKLDFNSFKIDTLNLPTQIVSDNPEFDRFNQKMTIAESELLLNAKKRKPQWMVGADYIFTGQRDDMNPMNNGKDILQIKLGMKLPINGQKFVSKVEEETLKLSSLELEKQYKIFEIEQSVYSLMSRYEVLKRERLRVVNQISLIERIIQLMLDGYELGQSELEDILLQEQKLLTLKLTNTNIDLESQLIAAQLRYLGLQEIIYQDEK